MTRHAAGPLVLSGRVRHVPGMQGRETKARKSGDFLFLQGSGPDTPRQGRYTKFWVCSSVG